jgi:hypothetical protein
MNSVVSQPVLRQSSSHDSHRPRFLTRLAWPLASWHACSERHFLETSRSFAPRTQRADVSACPPKDRVPACVAAGAAPRHSRKNHSDRATLPSIRCDRTVSISLNARVTSSFKCRRPPNTQEKRPLQSRAARCQRLFQSVFISQLEGRAGPAECTCSPNRTLKRGDSSCANHADKPLRRLTPIYPTLSAARWHSQCCLWP